MFLEWCYEYQAHMVFKNRVFLFVEKLEWITIFSQHHICFVVDVCLPSQHRQTYVIMMFLAIACILHYVHDSSI